MYSSLKPWLNISVSIKKFISRDGTGKPLYAEPVKVLCYPADVPQAVRNDSGEEVISNTTLYFDGDVDIDVLDKILFEGKEYNILSSTNHYRAGKIDCRTVKI